jgi:hypothetical protein
MNDRRTPHASSRYTSPDAAIPYTRVSLIFYRYLLPILADLEPFAGWHRFKSVPMCAADLVFYAQRPLSAPRG